MHFHLYKMTLEGKIAVANMVLVAAVVLVFPLTSYGSGGLPDPVGVLAILVLTFPVGWLSAFFLNHFRDQPLLAVVLMTAALPMEHAVILRPACGPKNLAVTQRERRDSSLRSE